MKKLFLAAIGFLAFAGCNKDVSTSGSTQIVKSGANIIVRQDTFTLVDNGVTYADSNFDVQVSCTLTKAPNYSILDFGVDGGFSFFPIVFEIILQGPLNGIGSFSQSSNVSGSNFDEYFNGVDVSWTVQSAQAYISYAGTDYLKGTYSIYISNGSSYKTVTGVINVNNPEIE